MDDHKPGDMDISAQQKTFAGFIRIATWGVAICFLVLIVMALADG